MKCRFWLTRGATSVVFGVALLVPLLLLASLLMPAMAQADGGIALSGSFYQQAFQIPQGSSASGPSIYVMVFNNGNAAMQVRMTTQAPDGVTVNLSQSEFTLLPKGQQKVLVGVDVAKDANPGEYQITVTAESYKENTGGGIQLAGAAGQNAKLTILGESAQVVVQATSPDGQPIMATVHLYRIIDSKGNRREMAYSETGRLEARVAPGDFIANSFVGGEQVAEESFTVAANDNKVITLAGKTVYFEGFGTVPNYRKSDGKLAFVEVVYDIKNLYQSVPKAEVFLEVSLNGAVVEDFSLATLSPLELGSKEFSYRYIPTEGWQDGNYTFKLRLEIDGQLYTTSPVEQLQMSGGVDVNATPTATPGTPVVTAIPSVTATPGTPSTGGGGGGSNTGMIIGIIAGVAVVVIAGTWFVLRRKKA